MKKFVIAVLALCFFLPGCSKNEKIRGEISVSVPMERFLFKKPVPVPFGIKTEKGEFSGYLTEAQVEDEKFELAWSVCDFVLSPTKEKDEDGTPLYKVETQTNCVSTLKE